MVPVSSLLAASGSWSFGEFACVAAAAVGAVRFRRALRGHALDGEARAAWTEATLRGRTRFRALSRAVVAVALVVVAVGLLRSANVLERSGVLAFAVSSAVGLAVFAVAAALERATRARLPVAARVSALASAEAATSGSRSALLVVAGLGAGAAASVALFFDGSLAAWGFAAGTLLVAWIAHGASGAAPAATRLVGLVSVQAFALAAASDLASPDVAALARLLVACGALLPWVVRTRTAEGLEVDAGRRLVMPFVALLVVGTILAQFLPRDESVAEGAKAFETQAAGLVLAAFVARLGTWRARPPRLAEAPAVASLFPLLVLAAVLVFASSQGGAAGLALATAAAAALLPVVTLDGVGADVAARTAADGAANGATGDGARDASCAVVVLAGWAALRSAPGALDLREPATAGALLVGVLVALLAIASSFRGGGKGSSDSTGARPRAMIAPAVLAAAVPWLAARLDAAAGGGIAAGVLLGGGTAAFLAPLSAAAPLERIVQLTGVVLAFSPR